MGKPRKWLLKKKKTGWVRSTKQHKYFYKEILPLGFLNMVIKLGSRPEQVFTWLQIFGQDSSQVMRDGLLIKGENSIDLSKLKITRNYKQIYVDGINICSSLGLTGSKWRNGKRMALLEGQFTVGSQ